MIIEREFRFVPAAALPPTAVTRPHWQGYAVASLPPEHQRNTYLDTPTQALARQGISFRRRVLVDAATDAPHRAELTLKLPRAAADHLFVRPEYTEPIDPGETLSGHPLLTLAATFVADEPIAPWFTFHTDRRGVALSRPNAAIHLTWDRLSLPDDPAFQDEEIEAELVDGPVAALQALADRLIAGYGLRYGDDGKRSRVGRYLARQGRISFPGVRTED
jgi:inorganic triphosphatase YgiF